MQPNIADDQPVSITRTIVVSPEPYAGAAPSGPHQFTVPTMDMYVQLLEPDVELDPADTYTVDDIPPLENFLEFIVPDIVLTPEEPPPPAAPVVTGVTPPFGNQGETLDIAVTGSGFAEDALVDFLCASNITVNQTSYVTSTEVHANITIAEHSPAQAHPFTVYSNGQYSNDGSFTVVAAGTPPQLYSMDPSTIPAGGGATVFFTGTGFNDLDFELNLPPGFHYPVHNPGGDNDFSGEIYVDVDVEPGDYPISVHNGAGDSNQLLMTVTEPQGPPYVVDDIPPMETYMDSVAPTWEHATHYYIQAATMESFSEMLGADSVQYTMVTVSPSDGANLPITENPIFGFVIDTEEDPVLVHVEVDDNMSSSSPASAVVEVLDTTGQDATTVTVPMELEPGTTYFWRYRVLFGEFTGPWVSDLDFTVNAEVADTYYFGSWTVITGTASPVIWFLYPASAQTGDEITIYGQGLNKATAKVAVGTKEATIIEKATVAGDLDEDARIDETTGEVTIDHDEITFLVPDVPAPGASVTVTV